MHEVTKTGASRTSAGIGDRFGETAGIAQSAEGVPPSSPVRGATGFVATQPIRIW
jgi:hypothetical protein